jgi:hypothetical protein
VFVIRLISFFHNILKEFSFHTETIQMIYHIFYNNIQQLLNYFIFTLLDPLISFSGFSTQNKSIKMHPKL